MDSPGRGLAWQGVDFVMNAREGVAATLTVQHLMLNRNALFRCPEEHSRPRGVRESRSRSMSRR